MKKLISIFMLLAGMAFGADRIQLSVTVTNTPSHGNSVTINSTTRTWVTNSPSALQVLISTNNIYVSTTNMFQSFVNTPVVGQINVIQTSSNIFKFVGITDQALSGSISGSWGYLTATTNVATSMLAVRVPISGEATETQRTNIASQIVQGINSFSTNQFDPSLITLPGTVVLTNNSAFVFALTNITSNMPWVTVGGQGTRVYTFNTNTTKIALASFSDNNAGSFTNFPGNVVTTNGSYFLMGNFSFKGASLLYSPLTYSGSLINFVPETGSYGGSNLFLGTSGVGSIAELDNEVFRLPNLAAATNSFDALTRGFGDSLYVSNSNPSFVYGITNITSNAPWLTVEGQGTRVYTVNTNSTKIAIASYTDNNAGSLTNFPSQVILTNSPTFRWAQGYYIGQLANSTYGGNTLTISTLAGLKQAAFYQTNGTQNGIPVFGLPTERLKGKRVLIKSLWANFIGGAGTLYVDHALYGATNEVWVGSFPPYRGANPHWQSVFTVTNTLNVTPTNQFWLVSTNIVSSIATDVEASVQFRNTLTQYGTNLALIKIEVEEIP